MSDDQQAALIAIVFIALAAAVLAVLAPEGH